MTIQITESVGRYETDCLDSYLIEQIEIAFETQEVFVPYGLSQICIQIWWG